MQEFAERSGLENHKLELLTEISQLHLRHSSLERNGYELRELLKKAKVQIPASLDKVGGGPSDPVR